MKRILFSILLFLAAQLLAAESTKQKVEGEVAQKAYIFTYFDTKKQAAGFCLAYSYDGYHWTPINENKPIMKPTVGKDKLLRDPSICQGPDGTFHLVWTSSWTEPIIGYATSRDLIHWSEQKAIPVMADYPGCRNAWAPELFYDKKTKTYYIYWASTVPDAKGVKTEGCLSENNYNHRIYMTSTKDFQTFTKTRLWFNPDFNAIDAAVVEDPSNGQLIMAVKNENLHPAEKNIRIVTGKSMKKGFSKKVSEPIHGKERCEGPAPLFVGDDLLVYYDMYGRHKFGASVSHDHGKTWEDATDKISMPAGMSHGTAIAVDRAVVDSLIIHNSQFIIHNSQSTILNDSVFSFGTKTNPSGVKFEVDGQGFIIGGKHVVPVMGELHYSRVPRADWRREIRKMKAGGITIVAAYAFWSHHEAEEGKWDFTGNKDLRAFLQVCKEEDMMVVLRVGPFCHGEVYLGGFPLWLAEKAFGTDGKTTEAVAADPKNFKLRSEAPGFMAAVTKLYQQYGEQAKGLLWKDGGPVVGVQIENECHGPWSYLMALRDIAIKAGFDVPFMTKTGWPKLSGKEEFGKLLPLYGDYADGFWDRKLTDMPGSYRDAFKMKLGRISANIATETFTKDQLKDDEKSSAKKQSSDGKLSNRPLSYPYLTCELGGGMMPSYHRRINISGKEAFPLAICKLGSGSNLPGYYMYHGGTNPYCAEHTMAECQNSLTTNYNDMPYMTYDFQAPLGEMGQPNWTGYHETRWLHQFLADWGDELATMDVDSLSDHYARRGCFVFRNDYVRILNEGGSASVTPQGMNWKGQTITSSEVQPFAKADGLAYFIQLTDKPVQLNVKDVKVLTREQAELAYVIDGKMHFASEPNTILYKVGDSIKAETWLTLGSSGKANPLAVSYKLTKKAAAPRKVEMGNQKVAEQPSNADFDKAAVYTVNLTLNKAQLAKISKDATADDLFLQINYKGDVARVYADGRLVEDNFWNGKPMLVRLSDVLGKKVELRILPMGKDYPIYLQAEQKASLDKAPAKTGLLSLDSICTLIRR